MWKVMENFREKSREFKVKNNVHPDRQDHVDSVSDWRLVLN